MNLIDEIQALSLQDKERLCSYLGQLIQDEKLRKMEEIKMSVCAAMNLNTYDPRRRKRENVIVRIITANVLLGMGCTETSVGKAMRKDHSTIHHYKETMNTWFNYPGLYKEEVTIWNKIKQEYETD
jgi:hypothetical protein